MVLEQNPEITFRPTEHKDITHAYEYITGIYNKNRNK